ncbi:hypothetical protein QUA71_26680 [Microcoleus sp. MON1_C5]|uniref:hypothetical protein n=1 Tax=Microcoleus sp. MON1_C5 TaxID=2818828 RepID=UPI002FCEE5F7
MSYFAKYAIPTTAVFTSATASHSDTSGLTEKYDAVLSSVKNFPEPDYDSIIAIFPLTTTLNRDFFAVGFETIGGAA